MVDVLWVDTVTSLNSSHRGKVLIGGSHGGLYAGYLAAKAGVKAVILHNAGVGKNSAGIGSLSYLEKLGMPAAALQHRSARIADGKDQLNRGIISHVNKIAGSLGCYQDQSCEDCATRMKLADQWSSAIPEFGESRFLLRKARKCGEPNVWGIDSLSLLRNDDRGEIIITGSHGGLFKNSENKLMEEPPTAMIFNDAGLSADRSGIARLSLLDDQNIIAATVSHTSACIGQAKSVWENGILSHVNNRAKNFGIFPDNNLLTFCHKVIDALQHSCYK